MRRRILPELAGAPTVRQLEAELRREMYRYAYLRTLGRGLSVLAAAAVCMTLFLRMFPVLRIQGDGMADTLREGDIVIAAAYGRCTPGSVAAFYQNNTLLVRRVIASGGDWVDIDGAGRILVNGIPLDGVCAAEAHQSLCDSALPLQVREGEYFVCLSCSCLEPDGGSGRIVCAEGNSVAGRLLFRIWPLPRMGPVR